MNYILKVTLLVTSQTDQITDVNFMPGTHASDETVYIILVMQCLWKIDFTNMWYWFFPCFMLNLSITVLERSSTKLLEMSTPHVQFSHLLLLVRLLLCPALYLDRIIDFFYWMINLYYCSRSSDPVSCARIKGRIKSVPLSSAESSTASLQARVSASQIAFHI